MKRPSIFLLLPATLLCLSSPARALGMTFKQVAPGIYAYIGDTGLRTYENEGMNGNAGFVIRSSSPFS